MWPILFQKKNFPQKAGNICIITRVFYNFWGLNFVKIRHKRRAEISITTSRTLAYRHFKQSKHQLILTPNRGSRDRQTAHTQIHQSSCQKLTPCFNGMLRIVGNILFMACLWDGNGVCCALMIWLGIKYKYHIGSLKLQ